MPDLERERSHHILTPRDEALVLKVPISTPQKPDLLPERARNLGLHLKPLTSDFLSLTIPFVPFSYIVQGPKRLEICPVEALLLLFGVFKIERSARTYMIYVPALETIVFPGHSW